ncbi:ABC transporter ATP-binding protein [Nakamurella sp. A5-74]|uniref:ABC transporter ATP-binding protein n=1 Tax=Nakamurella sp. A5-74 TaxID=3158264 RepID=A0AAU8DJ69_9ACTN
MIELQGVSRTFHSRGREVQALQDVSLSIPRGSAYGIVGESGSGKSTMMRLIAGLDTPSAGRVTVNGTDITGLPERRLGPLRRSLQVVFQDPMGSLDPRMRIGRIVAEPLVAQGHADPAARVREVLGQVDLDPEIVNRYPHQFSGGQRQRISIARAIAPDPEILVADEAVSALDVTVRAQILDLIADIAAARSLTLVFVSHDLSVVRRVCDQVAVLQRGRIVESGPVAEVYDRPQQDYTRQLLAAVPDLQQSLALARARQDNRERNR